MLDIRTDILPLTVFQRRTAELDDQLRSGKRPVVVTVNGKAELVVRDAVARHGLQDQLAAWQGQGRSA